MEKEQLINWFWTKFNSCYPVRHSDYPESIFMYYDEQFVRKIKLSKISNLGIVLPTKIKGVCLFELDWKNRCFFYNNLEIYCFLKNNFECNHQGINAFVKDRLNEADKLSVLTPVPFIWPVFFTLNEADKLSVLTPTPSTTMILPVLNEADKLSVLTPSHAFELARRLLNEEDKMSIIYI